MTGRIYLYDDLAFSTNLISLEPQFPGPGTNKKIYKLDMRIFSIKEITGEEILIAYKERDPIN